MTPDIKTERDLFEWLKRRRSDGMWQRIEASTGEGIPDVNVLLPQRNHLPLEPWLELKIGRLQGLKTEKPIVVFKWRKAQRAWSMGREAKQGQVAVVIWIRHPAPALVPLVVVSPRLLHKHVQPHGALDKEYWEADYGWLNRCCHHLLAHLLHYV